MGRLTLGRSKPGGYQAVSIMLLAGGIYGLIWALGVVAGSYGGCCFWPGTYYEIVFGIMAIIKASDMLGANPQRTSPQYMSIMQIICIVNGDIVNLIMGIVGVVLLNDELVQRYIYRN